MTTVDVVSSKVDVRDLKSLLKRFKAMARGSALLFASRVRLDGKSAGWFQRDDSWSEFLGTQKIHDYFCMNTAWGKLQHGCYYGKQEKLNEFTLIAAETLHVLKFPYMNLPSKYEPSSSAERDRWASNLFAAASRLDGAIRIDSAGLSPYSRFQVSEKMAISALDPSKEEPDHAMALKYIQCHIESNVTLKLPWYIYGSLDLISASIKCLQAELQLIPLTSLPTTTKPQGNADNFEFEPGGFMFAERRVRLSGVLLALMQRLAYAQRALGLGELTEGERLQEGTVRGHLSELRKVLRDGFGLSRTEDPIPHVDHGANAAWELNKEMLQRGAAKLNSGSQRISSAKP